MLFKILPFRWGTAFLVSAFISLAWLPKAAIASDGNKFLFAFSGGGESASDAAFFEKSFKKLIKKSFREHYTISGLYGANIERAKQVSRSSKLRDILPFTPETFEHKIQQIRSQIGITFFPGDQILFFIDAHGAKQKNRQLSHSVFCGNFENCDLDLLRPLFSELRSAQIKVALIDASCYSGATLALSDTQACIITMTRPEVVAVSSTYQSFLRHLHPQKNLEQVFLQARQDRSFWRMETYFGGTPQISSPAGTWAQSVLAPSLRFVDYHIVSQFSQFRRQPEEYAQAVEQRASSILFIPHGPNTLISDSLISRYQDAMESYHEFFDRYFEIYQKIYPDFGRLKLLSSEECPITWHDAVVRKILPPKCLKSISQKIKDDPEFADYYSLQTILRDYESQFFSINQLSGSTVTLFSDLNFKMQKVLRAENEIYSLLYTEFENSQTFFEDENPCRNIEF